jgi:hypothetical protein
MVVERVGGTQLVDFIRLLVLVRINFWSGCTNFLMERRFGGWKYGLLKTL